MAKIAIFDSGLGSLTVIGPIQKKIRSEIFYFADQESYPYGTKSARELRKIIGSTIQKLEARFRPDLIVVASNTPSLLIGPDTKKKILGVYPPLEEAVKKSSTGMIAILTTRSVVKSTKLREYIKSRVPSSTRVFKVDATPLVDLVESGMFITKRQSSMKKIRNALQPVVGKGVDVATLSSTHLPFLLPLLREAFPQVTFLDPADALAERVSKILKKQDEKNRLGIYASGDARKFQKKLQKIGVRKTVSLL